jgi:hypothetical protein
MSIAGEASPQVPASIAPAMSATSPVISPDHRLAAFSNTARCAGVMGVRKQRVIW